MARDIFDSTIKTRTEDVQGPVENPGCLIERLDSGDVTFTLDLTVVILGTDPAANVEFQGRSIAPYHAEIVHKDGNYTLRHLDGREKIKVNGKVISERFLRDGDVIAIGDRWFTFQKSNTMAGSDG